MKKVSIGLVFSLALIAQPQASELMNEKIGKLSYEQKRELFEKMSDKDFDAVSSFWETQNYRSIKNKKHIDEFSFKEMIEEINEERRDVGVALNNR